MNISCNIIRDLLPLYAEDMVSQDSRELVDSHLCGCDGCTKELAELMKRPAVPVEAEAGSLQRVSNTLRRQKVLTVLCVLMTVISILVTGMTVCTTQVYLPYSEAVESVQMMEDGSLMVDYSRTLVGTGSISDAEGVTEFMACNTTVYDYVQAKLLDRKISKMSQEEIEAYIADLYQIEKYYQRTEITEEDWDRFFGIHRYYCFRDQNGNYIVSEMAELPEIVVASYEEQGKQYTRTDFDHNLVYYNRDGNGGTVMYDSGKPIDWQWPERVQGGYLWGECFWACVVLSAALFVLLWKKRSFYLRELVVRIAAALACIAFGLLAVSFGQFNFAGERLSFSWFSRGSAIAVSTLLTAILWRQLWLLNHGDKNA